MPLLLAVVALFVECVVLSATMTVTELCHQSLLFEGRPHYRLAT
jgi:hypothetical protein